MQSLKLKRKLSKFGELSFFYLITLTDEILSIDLGLAIVPETIKKAYQ